MRVAMVTNDEFPPDSRIEKEAISLEEAGNEVFTCTPFTRPMNDPAQRFRIVPIEDGLSITSGLAGGLYRILKTMSADVVHIQDTPAALPGVVAAKRLRIPVIFDIHEIWPTLVIENADSASSHEKLWSKKLQLGEIFGWLSAAYVLTVVEEASVFFSSRYKTNTDRITAIRNFEDIERFRDILPDEALSEDARFKVTYVGTVDGTIRGIREMLDAAKLLMKEDVCFNVVGDGPYRPFLQHLSGMLHLEDKVRFLGRKSFREAMSIAAASDACIVPHRSCISTEFSLPHKISQYMALKRLTISSNLGPIKRIFGGCYIPWDPRTPEVLANIIREAKETKSVTTQTAAKGYELVRDKHPWKGEGRRLARMYESFSRR